MNFFKKIQARFIKKDINNLEEKSNHQLNQMELTVIQESLIETLDQLVKQLKAEREAPVKKLKIVLPLTFLKNISKDKKEISAGQIFDSEDQLIEELPLEDFKIKAEKKEFTNELYEKIMTKKLYLLIEELDSIVEIAEEFEKKLNNARYYKINHAIKELEKSYTVEDVELKNELQKYNEAKLKTSMEALYKQIQDRLDYFRAWRFRSELRNDYSIKTITKKFHYLMEDYLFFTEAKNGLINLKEKQEMDRSEIFELIEELDKIDREFKGMNLENWLNPSNSENFWQHKLFKRLEINYLEIVLDYLIEEK